MARAYQARQIVLYVRSQPTGRSPLLARRTAGRRAVINRGFALLPSQMIQRQSGRSVYLCIGALGMNIRFCRDQGRPDHDRSSGTSATWRIPSTGLSLAGGALRCSARPPRRPLPRARCAAAGPSCLPSRARCCRRRCRTRSAAHAVQHPFRSRAHASRRYRRAIAPPVRAQASGSHPGGDLVSAGGVPSCRSTAASAPIAEPQRSRECSVPPRQQAAAVADCAGRERTIEAVRDGE